MTTAPCRSRWALVTAAAMLAPFVMVQAGRMLSGGGLTPTTASLAPVVDTPVVALAPTGPSAEQRLAMEWSRANREPRSRRSPLATPEPPAPPMTLPVSLTPAPLPAPPDAVLATLHVNSIMGGDDNGVAVINRVLYRIGDTVAPGWRLASVNARNRSILLGGPDGRTARLDLGQ
jgi:hypothetical protein